MRTTGATSGFEELALPVAVKKDMGVIAMKVFAQEQILGPLAPEDLLRYALSLPVSMASLGMPQLAHLDANLAVARAFEPLPEHQLDQLRDAYDAGVKVSLNRFFEGHVDC